MRKFLAALITYALLSIAPAFAGIAIIGSTSAPLASGNVGTGSNGVQTGATTVDVPIGSLVYIACTSRGNFDNFSSATDSAGNTYPAPSGKTTSSNQTLNWSYAKTTIDLPIGSTFTCNGADTAQHGIRVLALSGVASHDTTGSATPTSGTGTVTSIGPGGALACPGGGANCEALVVGWTIQSAGSQSSLSFSPSGVTTSLGCDNGNFAGICLAYGILSVTTAQSFSSTNPTSAVWAMDMEAFQATTAAAPVCRRSLIGVGC